MKSNRQRMMSSHPYRVTCKPTISSENVLQIPAPGTRRDAINVGEAAVQPRREYWPGTSISKSGLRW